MLATFVYRIFCSLEFPQAIRPLPVSVNLRLLLYIPIAILAFGLFTSDARLGINFDLNSLYEYRIQQREVLKELPRYVNYFLVWVPFIILPLLLYVGLVRRNYFDIACAVILIVLAFFILNKKAALIGPAFTIALYFAVVLSKRYGLILLFLMVILLAIPAYVIFGDTFYMHTFPRRVVYVPALVNIAYFDFFFENETVKLSSSIGRWISEYPYDLQPPNLIGRERFHAPEMNANSGVYGTGYMHFREFGPPVFMFVLGVVTAYLNSLKLARVSPIFLLVAVGQPLWIIFTSADIFSGLLTNGTLFMVFFLMLVDPEKEGLLDHD